MADTTGFNLADILTQIGELQTNLRGGIKEAKTTTEENVKLGMEQVAGAKRVIDLSMDAARFDNNQKLQMEDRKRATAAAFNVDILNPDNELAYLAGEKRSAVRESIEQSKRASDLRATSVLDSPFEYFINRPFATQNDTAAANAATRATMIDKAIDDINAGAQSTIKTQEAINENFNADQAATRLELVGEAAKQKAAETALSVNRNNLQDLQVLRGMRTAEIAQATKGYELVRHEQEFNARMAEFEANRLNRLEVAKAKKRSNQELMDAYNAEASAIGLRTFTDATAFAETMARPVSAKLLGPILEKGLGRLADIEFSAQSGKPIPGAIAGSTGDAVTYLAAVGGKLSPTAQRTADFLNVSYNVAKDAAIKVEKDGKVTDDQIALGVNRILGDRAEKDEKSGKVKRVVEGAASKAMNNPEAPVAVGGVVTANPYAAPDIGTLLAAKPDMAKEPWFAEIVTPAAVGTGKPLERAQPTGNQLFQNAKLAVASGKLTLDQATAGLNEYLSTAVNVNMANEQYQRVGLPVPRSYNIAVNPKEGTLGIGRSAGTVVDGLSVEKLKHELAKARVLAGMTAKQMQFGGQQ